MAKGGKRKGAGRPRGAMTVRSAEVVNRIAKKPGIVMLEIMVDNARHFFKVAKDAEKVMDTMAKEAMATENLDFEAQFKIMLAEVKKAAGLRLMAQQCAQEAARFLHAPIAAVSLPSSNPGADALTLPERLGVLTRLDQEDEIEASGGKVVMLKAKGG